MCVSTSIYPEVGTSCVPGTAGQSVRQEQREPEILAISPMAFTVQMQEWQEAGSALKGHCGCCTENSPQRGQEREAGWRWWRLHGG